MENQNEEVGTLDQQEEVLDLDTGTQDESQDETIEDVKAKLAKTEEIARNQRIRAEKAERLAKAKQPEVKPEVKSDEMSQTDFYALVKANVAEEDIGEIKDYASLKKISVSEALKTSFIKSYLSDKEEQRKVANATNVSNVRRGSSKISDETIISNANEGKFPENDDEMRRLIREKIGLNKVRK